ncbi:MAG: methyltransferase domain-containing protein [Patescibacteria group bacterium]
MILEEKESDFNGKISVVWDIGLGKYIKVGGITQSGGVVEFIWSDTLKRVKDKKSNIKSCLILGLGGGSVAKLVKKFWLESKITGVEIDPTMVDLGNKHLGLDKVGTKIKIGDALEFCKKCKEKFDLICIDTYVGDEFPKEFEDEKFLKLILKLLDKNGVAVFNRLYYDGKRPEAVKFGKKLEKVFRNVLWHYPEANVMFLCYNI